MRVKTKYPGVYYREVKRIGGRKGWRKGERVFYIVFKKDGKTFEEKVGGQYRDGMTPARANGIRTDRIEGRKKSRKEKREAEQARKAAEAAEADRWTIQRLFDAYIQTRPEGHSKVVDKNRFQKHLAPSLADKEPKDLVPDDVKKLLSSLTGKSPQTVKHVLNLLSWVVNFGVRENHCEQVPFHITKPRVSNCKTEDLTGEELDRLLQAIEADPNEQIKALMKTALYTGMRRGELFKLKWSDLNFERGFISIRTPKGGRDQIIPMNGATRAVLEQHERTGSEFVFPGRGGEQRRADGAALKRIVTAARLPAGFRPLHGLRHVYASMLASSGKVDMYTLQRLLTHKSPVMTQRYAHLRDEALRGAAELAGRLMTERNGEIDGLAGRNGLQPLD